MRKQFDFCRDVLPSQRLLPSPEASVSRDVRFVKDCPVNVRSVYTQGDAHHYLPKHCVGRIVALHPGDDLTEATATLRLPYRVRQVKGIPQHYLELLPKPLVALRPLHITDCRTGAHVEFSQACGVDGNSRYTATKVHHFVQAGQCGRIVKLDVERSRVDLVLKGRSRPVRFVPLNLLDLMGHAPEGQSWVRN